MTKFLLMLFRGLPAGMFIFFASGCFAQANKAANTTIDVAIDLISLAPRLYSR
jgi:hypothetical protein